MLMLLLLISSPFDLNAPRAFATRTRLKTSAILNCRCSAVSNADNLIVTTW
jgi:hypothetical protein